MSKRLKMEGVCNVQHQNIGYLPSDALYGDNTGLKKPRLWPRLMDRVLSLQEFVSASLHFVLSRCDEGVCFTIHVLLHAVKLNNLFLCFSPSFSPSAVWMYGFTDSPRKEASGSLVCLHQHVE